MNIEKIKKFLSGRAGRLEFIVWFLGSFGLSAVISWLLFEPALVFIWMALHLPNLLRRLHDLDLSAWYILVGAIPLINIFWALYLVSASGTEGSNKYGGVSEANPLILKLSWILFSLGVLVILLEMNNQGFF